MTLESKIEAVLFFKGEPLTHKRLAEILKVTSEDVASALAILKASLAGRGVELIEKGNEVALGTAPEMGKIIEDLQKEELNKELSRASLETLSIILYKNGVSRPEIDFIRGVNSSFILRALSVRGLVDRIPDPKDSRKILYKPSFDLMQFMGVKNIEELPDYEEIKREIDGAENGKSQVAP